MQLANWKPGKPDMLSQHAVASQTKARKARHAIPACSGSQSQIQKARGAIPAYRVQTCYPNIHCVKLVFYPSFVMGTECCVRFNNKDAVWFSVDSGVRQGCMAVPDLCNCVIDHLVTHVCQHTARVCLDNYYLNRWNMLI